MYVVSRTSPDDIGLTDNKYDTEEYPDFVGEPPVHRFTLAGWTQLCLRKDALGLGLGGGLRPGQYVTLMDTVVERLCPCCHTWNTKTSDAEVRPLTFYIVEHEAFLFALQDQRLIPIEMGGEFAVGHTVICEPLTAEMIELNSLLEP